MPLAALSFVLEYAIGGAGGASLGTVAAAMGGVHVLIGIGEGLITALVVGAVAATRPDLVEAAPKLEVMTRG
ncbi:MAG: cobalamin biosynthesis protein CbiM [Acidobacteria bacterium]|nr:cobalamin biosynthesis protein CbiM [Acidobacteriota bacterium]